MKFFIEGEEKVLAAGEELLIRRGTVHGFEVFRGGRVAFRERVVFEGSEQEEVRRGLDGEDEGVKDLEFKGR